LIYTGPNEVWWAPYDNRVGPADEPLPDFDPSRALLWPYLEGSRDVFHCPDGTDLTPHSPTYGRPYQVSYAVNKVTGGPGGLRLADLVNGSSNVMLAWDHANSPGCADDAGNPVRPYTAEAAEPHYPASRHGGVFNVLFCDGHVVGTTPDSLQDSSFYARP
jgi:prepilin-type processing-associated H-X9-DG protein